MFKLFIVLFCLLLSGCAAESAPGKPPSEPTAALTDNEPSVLGEVKEDWESRYPDRVQVYPLNLQKVREMRSIGSDLFLLSGYGSTTITRLSGETLSETAGITLDFELDPADPSFRVHSDFFSYYDPSAKETVLLDSALQPLRRISAPKDMEGTPLLSRDGNTLYYCTSNAIRAWDLNTDIRRRIKEISGVSLSALLLNDTVLQYELSDDSSSRSYFLAVDNGKLLKTLEGGISMVCDGEAYYGSFPAGNLCTLVFGQGENAPFALLPQDLGAQCTFLPALNAGITLSDTQSGIQLDYYDLDTGHRYAALSLGQLHTPIAMTNIGTDVCILLYDPAYDCHLILRWKIPESPLSPEIYTDTYYSASSPNTAGIAACQAYADEIGAKYAIQVKVWEDATAVKPWDYDLEPEHLQRVIMEELSLLDQRLSQYPEGFLAAAASHFDSLNICLVRQITGTAASGTLDAATGVQFFQNNDAYVVIAAGEFSEQALYHELYHVLETHILNNSTELDHWNSLNPSGFSYDYDYTANARRNSGIYLQSEYRAFVDTYSMSFPKEDRARILEYAMLPGQEGLFQTKIMQSKLKALCQGIREAYDLEKAEEIFLWEQYLEESLAYKG